jgi:hypothetical protein
MNSRTPTLYHYTCGHGRDAIGDTGLVVPIRISTPHAAATMDAGDHAWMADVAWFTDLPVVDRDALGLTSATIDCDRGEYRFRVLDASLCTKYTEAWRSIPRRDHLALSRAIGARPAHWFIARQPVPVCLDVLQSSVWH